MSKPPFDLVHVLDPVAPAVFFDTYWEKQPLHVTRSDAAYYDSVLTIADLERHIANPDVRYPAVQLSKGGVYLPPAVFTEDVKFASDTFTGVLNVQKINAEYRAGATLVLPALHRTWPALGNLCAQLDLALDHVAHANAYLTPGNTAGFTPHYDTHEVMVLQLAGTKHWRVFAPPIELPHRRQPFNPVGYSLPQAPLLEIDLVPGDLLYLPRGHIHTTTTSTTHSAHITIGIAVYTWIDLAGELLQSAMSLPKFRKALPPGFAHVDSKSALISQLEAVLAELHDSATAAQLVEAFLRRPKTPPRTDTATFRSDVSVIQPETPLQAPDPREYQIIDQGAKVAIEFQNRRFILPSGAKAALYEMRRRRTFRTVDLPDSLDLETALALVRTLLDKGFITLPG